MSETNKELFDALDESIRQARQTAQDLKEALDALLGVKEDAEKQ